MKANLLAALHKRGIESANKVFEIAELIELILLNVSQIDLFVTQRVCKAFQFAIQNTPKLQRRMFGPTEEYAHLQVVLKHPKERVSTVRGVSTDFRGRWHYTSYTSSVIVHTFCDPLDRYEGDHHNGRMGRINVHQDGPWKRMLLGKEVELEVLGFWNETKPFRVKIPAGGTMGDVLAVLEDLSERSARDEPYQIAGAAT
jgi:hypothetical protein